MAVGERGNAVGLGNVVVGCVDVSVDSLGAIQS